MVKTMKYETYISELRHYTYRDFRELYGQVKYALEVSGAIAEFDNDKHTIEAIHDLIKIAFYNAQGLLVDIHTKDDEYGTLFHTGVCRSYKEAAFKFIHYMEINMRCTLDFIIYDGEINSIGFRGFNPDCFITCSEQREIDETSDLPF
jgi:hypothetical protein